MVRREHILKEAWTGAHHQADQITGTMKDQMNITRQEEMASLMAGWRTGIQGMTKILEGMRMIIHQEEVITAPTSMMTIRVEMTEWVIDVDPMETTGWMTCTLMVEVTGWIICTHQCLVVVTWVQWKATDPLACVHTKDPMATHLAEMFMEDMIIISSQESHVA